MSRTERARAPGLWIGWLLGLGWTLGLGPQAPMEWKRVEPGLRLEFPADHGAHPEYETEWWYLTGQVEDARGERFGFQFTVFRRGLEPAAALPGESELRAREAFAGHLALTEVAAQRTRFAERLRRGSPLATAARGDLDVRLEDWSLRRSSTDGEALELAAADAAQGFGLALQLRPETPLVLHGVEGTSAKGGGTGNASAYVSWPRLAVEGTLARDGESRPVRGTAWFDHEFGSSVLADGAVGWDWFGLGLEEGRALMLFVLRDDAGRALEASAATWIERDGTARALTREEFTLTPTATWTSPRTAVRYPAAWKIAIPSLALELTLTPLVPDCELVGGASTGVTYWEGPLEVHGSTRGRGYAELTGYAGTLAGRF